MAVITSKGSAVQPAELKLRDWWLYTLNHGIVRLADVTYYEAEERENLAWFEPLNSNMAVPVFTEIMGRKIEMRLEFFTQEDFQMFRIMRRLQVPVYIKSPWHLAMWVRFNEGFRWIEHPGDGPRRSVTVAFTQVARPA